MAHAGMLCARELCTRARFEVYSKPSETNGIIFNPFYEVNIEMSLTIKSFRSRSNLEIRNYKTHLEVFWRALPGSFRQTLN